MPIIQSDLPKNKITNFLIKVLIVILLSWAIYAQVFARENASSLWQGIVSHFNYPNLLWLLLVIALAPINIGFETMKWKQLIKSFSSLGFFQIYKAILSGITIAIFTPNRVGEYGGRILFIEAKNNWKAVIATLVGSLAQLLIILSFGLIGLVFFSSHFLEVEWQMIAIVMSLGVLVVAVMVFCFFNIDILVPVVKRLPFIHYLKKHLKHLIVLKNYSSRELRTALFYAFLRFSTYTLQYYFLLKFFGIDVSFINGIAGITSIFFVQASIPLPPVMGLLARGEIALQVWGQFSQDEFGILGATFSLFVINIAVPALLGLVFIVQTNIMKSLGYESTKMP